MTNIVILEISKLIKKYWKQILITVIIAIMTGAISFLYNRLTHALEERDRLNEVVFKRTVEYNDERGRRVTESTEQRLRIAELQKLAEQGDSAKALLLREINLNKSKLKNVESMAISTIFVHDTLYSQFFMSDTSSPDTVKHYVSKYFDCSELSKDAMMCEYRDTLIWTIDKYHADKFKFKNLFVKRDWYYKLTAKYLNPDAKIGYQEYIRLETRKNKRKD